MSILGKFNHTAGNHRKYFIDYAPWKPCGVHVSNIVVVIDGTTTATIGSSGVEPTGKAFFFVLGGAADENFTVDVETTFSDTQVKNDTILFTVVAP